MARRKGGRKIGYIRDVIELPGRIYLSTHIYHLISESCPSHQQVPKSQSISGGFTVNASLPILYRLCSFHYINLSPPVRTTTSDNAPIQIEQRRNRCKSSQQATCNTRQLPSRTRNIFFTPINVPAH